MNFTPENILNLKAHEVFVFGSNLAGSHGAGAAALAVKSFGAVHGIGVGHVGQSFAIPSKDFRPQYNKNVLSTSHIKIYVDLFISYANYHPDLTFYVTKIGCGLAGYSPEDIAPLFSEAIHFPNIILPEEFFNILK